MPNKGGCNRLGEDKRTGNTPMGCCANINPPSPQQAKIKMIEVKKHLEGK